MQEGLVLVWQCTYLVTASVFAARENKRENRSENRRGKCTNVGAAVYIGDTSVGVSSDDIKKSALGATTLLRGT